MSTPYRSAISKYGDLPVSGFGCDTSSFFILNAIKNLNLLIEACISTPRKPIIEGLFLGRKCKNIRIIRLSACYKIYEL